MNNDLIPFSISVFTGIFAVMNPIANTPVFMGLVEGRSDKSKKHVAKLATFTAFIIIVSFVLLGQYLFQLFGITIPSFKIAGGILLFHVGFEMLQSKPSKIHNQELTEDDGIAISPLAIPILAGPGTIVTAMNKVTAGEHIHLAIVIAIVGLMSFLTYLAFSLSDKLVAKIGTNIITVIGKIMGLILTIIGVNMAIQGVKLAFNL
jgi:multiple antibiotic resistance protein